MYNKSKMKSSQHPPKTLIGRKDILHGKLLHILNIFVVMIIVASSCTANTTPHSHHARGILWKYSGISSGDVEEPMAIPDQAKEQQKLEIVLHKMAESSQYSNQKNKRFGPGRISIFTAPKPFLGDQGESQRRALISWLSLKPTPLVHLLGNHPSFYAIAHEFGSQVVVDPRVDCNFRGIPLFNSMVARAQAAKHPYSMIVPPDIVLFSDIFRALKVTREKFPHFVMFAAQIQLPKPSKGLFESLSDEIDEIAAIQYARENGRKFPGSTVGLWMWNNSPIPLVNTTSMPPFAFQRGRHDRWLASEVATAGFRGLVDVTDVATAVDPRGSQGQHKRGRWWGAGRGIPEELPMSEPIYEYQAPSAENSESAGESQEEGDGEGEGGDAGGGRKVVRLRKWNTGKADEAEVRVNKQLAEEHMAEASSRREMHEIEGEGGTNHLPEAWRLRRCTSGKRRVFCIRLAQCDNGISESDDNYEETLEASQESWDGNQWVCNHVTLPKLSERGRKNLQIVKLRTGGYRSLEDLLPLVADERKIVTLIAVSSLYKDMLMSFICMLRRLEFPNPLVSALDPELYRFASQQGLAVFYDKEAQKARLESAKNGTSCKFGTDCFKQVTKLKSRVVLHVLQLGYSVLWSDVDIVWFRDPLPELIAYDPGYFPVQSDQPKRWEPANGARGTSIPGGAINSGFYFARSEPRVIQAFQAIVKDAKTTNTSEQPSFYRVLCGEDGKNTVGEDECVWPKNGLRTVFISRYLHPNGKFNYYWYAENTARTCVKKGCATLHNNWIKGKQAKINRMKVKGLWYYDPNNRICLHTWYRQTQGLPLVVTNTDEEVEDQSPISSSS